MKTAIVSAVACALLAGCGTPPNPATAPGAMLEGKNLPTFDPRGQPLADSPAVAIRMQNPVYPFELRKKKIEGDVVVEYVVSETGKVVEALAFESPDPGLSKAAVDSVLQAEFRPAIHDGKPVAARYRMRIQFRL